MSFVPEDAFKKEGINLAPMIDFLFLMLMFFACLAISRTTSKETDIDLVEIKEETTASAEIAEAPQTIINILINEKGEYKWKTEWRDSVMSSSEEIAQQLKQDYESGRLPENKEQVLVLLKIDKRATWEPILKAIFVIRDAGFVVHPVYEPEEREKRVN